MMDHVRTFEHRTRALTAQERSRPFRFMNLPLELRNKIYRYMIPETPLSLLLVHQRECQHCRTWRKRTCDVVHDFPILRTNHHVNNEFKHIFFKHACIAVDLPRDFCLFEKVVERTVQGEWRFHWYTAFVFPNFKNYIVDPHGLAHEDYDVGQGELRNLIQVLGLVGNFNEANNLLAMGPPKKINLTINLRKLKPDVSLHDFSGSLVKRQDLLDQYKGKWARVISQIAWILDEGMGANTFIQYWKRPGLLPYDRYDPPVQETLQGFLKRCAADGMDLTELESDDAMRTSDTDSE